MDDVDNPTHRLLTQVNISVEGFYVFYEVPWDDQKYVKFKCPFVMRGNPQSDKLREEITFAQSPDFDLEDPDHKFAGAKYLGGARLTDDIYLRYILHSRTELIL